MDNSQDVTNSGAAAAAMFGTFFVIWMLFIVAIVALSIWFYWRIFTKAGFSGALSLLNLVPGIGPLICILILAFGEWPVLQGHNATPVQTGYSPPTTPTA
ncbi:MAG TPA: hypothetical protein VIN40_02755 [Candidatus Tyrphobacter sp.]